MARSGKKLSFLRTSRIVRMGQQCADDEGTGPTSWWEPTQSHSKKSLTSWIARKRSAMHLQNDSRERTTSHVSSRAAEKEMIDGYTFLFGAREEMAPPLRITLWEKRRQHIVDGGIIRERRPVECPTADFYLEAMTSRLTPTVPKKRTTALTGTSAYATTEKSHIQGVPSTRTDLQRLRLLHFSANHKRQKRYEENQEKRLMLVSQN